MIKNIVLQQKEERDFLLSQDYIIRINEDERAAFLSSSLIKLISGPRRAGKSVYALQMLKNKSFAYLNFDDDLLLKNFDEDKIVQAINEIYNGFDYLLLDEIQNLEGWELWISKLYRRGWNLIITGSNANLLSNELATSLTGRFLQTTILPFSFKEFVKFDRKDLIFNGQILTPTQIGNTQASLHEYLIHGGFPEIINSKNVSRHYLSTLYDSVLLKDVLRRYKIRMPQQLYDLANYLLVNYSNSFTYNNLKDAMQMNSVATVQKFVGYLSEPFLFIGLPRYSPKLKHIQKSAWKNYVIDNGFISAKSFELSSNGGRLLENLVFVELLRRNYRAGIECFYYHTTNNKEVDFLLRKGNQIECLLQVSYDISNPKTLKREISALTQASSELGCKNLILISWNQEDTITSEGKTIEIIPAWKWLLY
jgi:predicted AAA+ superfamily ATPase